MAASIVPRTREVVSLGDVRATDPVVAGAKAANLARAASAGLPVLPGFVLTTTWTASALEEARVAWHALSGGGRRPVVVRSSSVGEDGGVSSMAGVFRSVVDVQGWRAFLAAVATVRASAIDAAAGDTPAPMAVLVQPLLDAAWGGVAFGADPVTHRRDRFVVAAVDTAPEALVSGEVDGWNAVLSTHGRLVDGSRGRADANSDGTDSSGAAAPPPGVRRALAGLVRRAGGVFGGPQDIEWAVDRAGTLWLLQSRPITSLHGRLDGPTFGPGPLAETFPDPLSPLEQELWLDPLRDGLREALTLTGTTAARAIARSPIAVSIDGRVAVDLDALGMTMPRRGLARVAARLDPRPPARRLVAAWRVGRLTRALPLLARDIVGQVDADLADVPALEDLANRELLAVLTNGRQSLRVLHGYEALAGLLVPATSDSAVTAASMALSAVAQARTEGLSLCDLVERDPVVLALVPPRVGPPPAFGAIDAMPVTSSTIGEPDEASIAREALRLRTRWVQELTGRASWELGRRLVSVGVLPSHESVRLLAIDELRDAVLHRRIPDDLGTRREPAGPPLPSRFRRAADGTPVATTDGNRRGSDGAVGAGGGIGRGPVHRDTDQVPAPGAVLVVAHLDPRLALVIGRLGGLVAETGSPLSHLAILAREHGVPVVVGVRDARERFHDGQLVEVDGIAGTVVTIDDPTAGETPRPAAAPIDLDHADLTVGVAR